MGKIARRCARLWATWLTAVIVVAAPARAEDFITIGTGSVSGLYYPMGTAICRLLNKDRRRHGIRCTAEVTNGSVANLQALRRGELDFAIVQSDWQAQAVAGTPLLANGVPFSDLRALFSLHGEVFTVVARVDADIHSFSDLRGKRVNIGNPGSGQRATMEGLMAVLGWSRDSFAEVHELPAETQSEALCADEIDAMVFTVGHPSASVEAATTACDSLLVPVNDPQIRAIVSSSPFYDFAQIPAHLYRGNPEVVHSFGFAATLVTTRQQKLKVVHEMVRSVFSNLDTLRRAHPAFGALNAASMVEDYQTAPLHRAARAYYRFDGLLERSSP
ncbi:TAXI family TRAP transporter solute-binding subunit [Epibacterium sp. MM17-32]|uniref:TAXI family TRAP transporter solute-binding subunit n=1 Tax=Epibacterium sp. MM17-32 TaxID=2917734 RepID=UPI001EF6E6A2|nr:TAXI family TRAP transporter solute-binding subunit [Epibacterium sp. MM17-32]MCG7626562.1 TAXI family TRAP transporter solute-binding subunit [Epibacterium sp. MM17-32]